MMYKKQFIRAAIIFGLLFFIAVFVFIVLRAQNRLLLQANAEARQARNAEATAIVASNQRSTAEAQTQSLISTLESETSMRATVEAEATLTAATHSADIVSSTLTKPISSAHNSGMFAYQLALEADIQLSEQVGLFPLTALLAVEAVKRFPTVETVQVLKEAVTLLPNHRTQITFTHSLQDVAYSPDGQYIAVSDYDEKTIKVYDIQSGNEIVRLTHKISSIDDLTFSAEGDYIAGHGRYDEQHTVIVWEVDTGRRVIQYKEETYFYIHQLSFSLDSQYFGLVTNDTAQLWELDTGQQIRNWPHNGSELTFSADGKEVYIVDTSIRRFNISTNTSEGLIDIQHNGSRSVFSPQNNYLLQIDRFYHHRIWSLVTGEAVTLTQSHGSGVVFSPDERYVATLDTEGSLVGMSYGFNLVQVWDVNSGQAVMNIEGRAYDLTFSPDSRYLAVSFGDDLRVWDTVNWQEVKRISGDNRITEIAFSPNGQQIITVQPGWGTNSGRVDVWDMNVLPLQLHIEHLMQPRDIYEAVYSPDGKYLATGGSNWDVYLWDIANGLEVMRLDRGDRTNTLAFTPDSQYLLSGGARNPPGSQPSGIVQLWDLNAASQVFTITTNADTTNATFSPDGQYFAIANSGIESDVQVFETATNSEAISIPDTGYHGVFFSSDGHYLLTAGFGGFEAWETATWQRIVVVDERLNSISPNLDSQYFAANVDGNLVKIWDVTTGEEIMIIPDQGYVSNIDISPDGQYLATENSNINGGFIQVWDIVSQEKTLELLQGQSVHSLSFSPDGRYLVFGTESGNGTYFVSIWDLVTNREINRLGHPSFISSIAFSPDGSQLLTISGGTQVHLWQWHPNDLIAAVCDRLVRNLTQAEWQQYLGNEPYQPTCPNLPNE